MPLTLHSRFAGDVYIIQCAGPIVLGPENAALEAALDRAITDRFHRLVLSLTEVTRVDSTGLGLIVRFAARLRHRGGDLRLASPPAFLTNLLSLTNLTQVLPSFPTEDDAILSFLKDANSAHAPTAAQAHGPRVLFLAGSADLGVFVRTVLEQHGFSVRSATLVRDARLLLQSEPTDYIVTSHAQPADAAHSPVAALQSIAPSAIALSLDANFSSLDAHQAADTLLALLQSHPA